MESSAPVSRYVARNSKKRVFSSSSVYKGVEVLDLSSPPSSPANRASKPNFSEQKKVICHEIIDVDVEDHVGALRIDESGKGKKALSNSLVGFGNLEKDGSGSDIQKSKHLNVDDFNPTLFFGEDVCIDTFYDDTVYDYAIWGSQFDHMDIPPGVEAPFPWLSDSHQDYSKAGDLTTTSSSAICNQAGQNPKLKMSSTISTSSEAFFTAKNYNDSLHPGNVSSSRKRKKCHVKSSSNCYPSLGMSGVGTHMPIWSNSPLNMLEPPIGSSTTMNGSGLSPLVQDSSYIQSGVTSVSVDKRNVDDQLTLFKKFDTVEDFSDHHFAKQASSAKLGQKNWAKKIQEEWRILEKDLPDTIFVRVYESRMDLLRAVIVGAEGTPYHDGLFFFDAFFPSNYPSVPPKVHYHSGGLRINPNLYNCGKVCLSLLNTWTGHGQEKWVPGKSTMLQVLVSIQGLILNAKPYFNEPGYANTVGTKQGEEKSLDYNENTFMYSLQTMVYSMRRPPKYFEAYVAAHFCKVAREVLVSCKAYLDGAQVGCLVKGGVQDVDEGDKSCSKSFKTRLAGYMSILVNAFIKIGAKDCQEFLNLSEKSGTKRATGAAPTNLYI